MPVESPFDTSKPFGKLKMQGILHAAHETASREECQAVNDYVEDGRTDFIVPIRDPEAIFEKLLLLATQPKLRDDMGMATAEAMLKVRPERFAEVVAAALTTIEQHRGNQ